MGPAVELFLLLIFLIAAGLGVALFLTRPLWKRAARTIIDTDRQEREALEEQARERAEEAEARRQAEEELHRALRCEDVPGSAMKRGETPPRKEAISTWQETKSAPEQAEERQ